MLSITCNDAKQHTYLLSQPTAHWPIFPGFSISFYLFVQCHAGMDQAHLQDPDRARTLCRGVQPVACGYYCTGHRVLCPLLPTAIRVSRDIPNRNKGPFVLAQTLHWHMSYTCRVRQAVAARMIVMTTEWRHPAWPPPTNIRWTIRRWYHMQTGRGNIRAERQADSLAAPAHEQRLPVWQETKNHAW